MSIKRLILSLLIIVIATPVKSQVQTVLNSPMNLRVSEQNAPDEMEVLRQVRFPDGRPVTLPPGAVVQFNPFQQPTFLPYGPNYLPSQHGFFGGLQVIQAPGLTPQQIAHLNQINLYGSANLINNAIQLDPLPSQPSNVRRYETRQMEIVYQSDWTYDQPNREADLPAQIERANRTVREAGNPTETSCSDCTPSGPTDPGSAPEQAPPTQGDPAQQPRPAAPDPQQAPAAPNPQQSSPAQGPINGHLAEKLQRMAAQAESLTEQPHKASIRAAIQNTLNFLNTRGNVVQNQNVITIIDYTQPSNLRRMYVFDFQTGQVRRELVAHGVGRPPEERLTPTFSNAPNSHKSSQGFFVTGAVYSGNNGRSIRLRGLDSTNNNAEARAVVIHGAPYVNDGAASRGRIGRSHGCPAVDHRIAQQLITRIQGASLVYSYGG